MPKQAEKPIKLIGFLFYLTVLVAFVCGLFPFPGRKKLKGFLRFGSMGFNWRIGQVDQTLFSGFTMSWTERVYLLLVLLTAVVSTLAAIASKFIKKEWKGYFMLFLILETGMLGVFTADKT